MGVSELDIESLRGESGNGSRIGECESSDSGEVRIDRVIGC